MAFGSREISEIIKRSNARHSESNIRKRQHLFGICYYLTDHNFATALLCCTHTGN